MTKPVGSWTQSADWLAGPVNRPFNRLETVTVLSRISELAVVPHVAEGIEVELLVQRPGGRVPRISSGPYHRYANANSLDLSHRSVDERGNYTGALTAGSDGNHLDLTRPSGALVDSRSIRLFEKNIRRLRYGEP